MDYICISDTEPSGVILGQTQSNKIFIWSVCYFRLQIRLIVNTKYIYLRIIALGKRIHMAVEGPSTKRIVFLMIPGTWHRLWRRLSTFVQGKLKLLSPWTFFVCEKDHHESNVSKNCWKITLFAKWCHSSIFHKILNAINFSKWPLVVSLTSSHLHRTSTSVVKLPLPMTVCPCVGTMVLVAVHLYVPAWERCMLFISSISLFCVRDPPTCCHVYWLLDVASGFENAIHGTDNACPSIIVTCLNESNSGSSIQQERYLQYSNIYCVRRTNDRNTGEELMHALSLNVLLLLRTNLYYHVCNILLSLFANNLFNLFFVSIYKCVTVWNSMLRFVPKRCQNEVIQKRLLLRCI